MLAKDLIQKVIRHLNLFHVAAAGNDNIARAKDAHRDPLTLAYTFACALALTEPRTGTNPRLLVRRIVEELGIHPLINRLLQHTEDTVLLHQNAVQILLLNIIVE